MRKIESNELCMKQPTAKWYLPHFAVVRNDRVTTKTHVVFDASTKCSGVSLNDMIHQEPKLQKNYLMCYFVSKGILLQ